MRSRTERTVWATVAVLLLGAAGAAWWWRAHWVDQVGPVSQQLWRKATRPGPESLPPGPGQAAGDRSGQGASKGAGANGAPPPPPPRKCLRDGRVTYTELPCPPGSQEQAVDGAVTVLP